MLINRQLKLYEFMNVVDNPLLRIGVYGDNYTCLRGYEYMKLVKTTSLR